jgi:site-specific recombinase XerD
MLPEQGPSSSSPQNRLDSAPKDLERRRLAASSIRRNLAAVASLFDQLWEANAVAHNPVREVKRPKAETNEGKTPALGSAQMARDRLFARVLFSLDVRKLIGESRSGSPLSSSRLLYSIQTPIVQCERG